MAQSTQPAPLRNNSTIVASSPVLSPHTLSEKRPHHVRRKSGKDVVVNSEKRSSTHLYRAAPITKRTTSQHVVKVVGGGSRTKHREEEDERRDSGESFPQFCMTCERQFMPANNTFLYCSDSCRRSDTSLSQPTRKDSIPSSSVSPTTPYFQPYSPNEGPDIIPRASPTQSRPRSYFNSEPHIHSYSFQPAATSSSTRTQSSTALASLRELATVLPKTQRHSSSNEETSPPISRTSSGVWNYISVPFSKGAATTPNITPQNSFNSKACTGDSASASYGGYFSSTDKNREDLIHAYTSAKSYGAPAAGYAPVMGGLGMDRPLPPRSTPGGYGARTRSIDLVTPYIQGQ